MKITQMLTIGWRVRFGYFASYCGHRPMPGLSDQIRSDWLALTERLLRFRETSGQLGQT